MAWDQQKFIKSIEILAAGFVFEKEFNDRVGVRDAIYRWTKKGDRPSLEVLLRVADEFGVSVDWLLYNEERQPEAKITIDNSHEICVPSSPFKTENIQTHLDVEDILNSQDQDAKNAFNYGLKGVLQALKEKKESVQLLREIASGQEEMVDLMRELSDVFATGGVSAGTVQHGTRRGKKAS